MVENAQRLDIPDLALGVPETFVKIFAICEHWPSGQASAEAAEAVWSDIPSLVMAGAYDNLTPVSWNKSAFVSLANSEFVLFPMAGHGTLVYSTCAKDIGAAFVANPSAPLDTACVAGLEPEWVLP
jgi:pimeloyl-ACP methyl ester carboxylesterase